MAAVTQHITEKSFQMVRYYGWYSNKLRGIRNKQGAERASHESVVEPGKDIEIIDVSGYQPPRIPSKSWRQLIKKVYACPTAFVAEGGHSYLSSLWRANEDRQFHYRSSGNTAYP